MHTHKIHDWQHSHNFSADNKKNERRALYVFWLTVITMVVEIIAGSVYGSMALLADGWHMSTHAAAFMITIFTYRYARKHADNPDFSFGTGKVNVLGGFASATALTVVALVMLLESVERIVSPHAILFNEAIAVACIGLTVNIISAFLLKDDHDHHHAHTHEHHAHDHNHNHDHDHDHGHGHHHDHNLKAAYMHVLADAMTSVLAIVALISGKYWGWHWLDPVMGIVGAIIISRWSYNLMKQSVPILLDSGIEDDYKREIRQAIENDSDNRVYDLHIWRISANHYAAIIALVTHHPKPAEHYKQLLHDFKKLSHITIEVNQCDEEHPVRSIATRNG
jgi:cation diffusion facilitator family transporter